MSSSLSKKSNNAMKRHNTSKTNGNPTFHAMHFAVLFRYVYLAAQILKQE